MTCNKLVDEGTNGTMPKGSGGGIGQKGRPKWTCGTTLERIAGVGFKIV